MEDLLASPRGEPKKGGGDGGDPGGGEPTDTPGDGVVGALDQTAVRVEGITIYRKDIDKRGEDKYGHWWIEIDGNESYGWWPKHPVDFWDTIFGISTRVGSGRRPAKNLSTSTDR